MRRINPYLRSQGAKAAYVEYNHEMVADAGLIKYYEFWFDEWEKVLNRCEERGKGVNTAYKILSKYADVLEKSYELRKELVSKRV